MQGEAAGTLNCGVRMQQRHDSDFSGPHFWLCFILYFFFGFQVRCISKISKRSKVNG